MDDGYPTTLRDAADKSQPDAEPALLPSAAPSKAPSPAEPPPPAVHALERAAIFLLGFSTFVPVFAPQSVLPQLASNFGASPAETGAVIGATTFAVALSAPLAGPLTDWIGRKRAMLAAITILVPLTLLLTLCTDLHQLLVVRFVQGIFLPSIFTGAVAYIASRWQGARGAALTGTFVSGSAIGGFAGRFIAGLLTDLVGWQSGFAALAVISALCAILVGLWLPTDAGRPTESILSHLRGMGYHLRDGRIRAVIACGAMVMFSMTGALSYLGFHLAEPPFGLSTAEVGLVFLVYPFCASSAMINGRLLRALGTGGAYRAALGLCATGQLLLLVPHLAAAVGGLSVFLVGIFLCQSMALGYVGRTATMNKGAAAGLYVSCFYFGGSLGAILPGLLWTAAGWAGCVGLILAALCAAALFSLAMRERDPMAVTVPTAAG